jgi:hypothetical protein
MKGGLPNLIEVGWQQGHGKERDEVAPAPFSIDHVLLQPPRCD